MGGDYYPMGYISQQQRANMLGMPNYSQQPMYPYGYDALRNCDPWDVIHRRRQANRKTPREILAMYFGPVPEDKEKLEKYLAEVADEVLKWDKKRNAAEDAMHSLNTKLKVAEKQKEALKKHYRLKSSWVYKLAVTGIFVTVGILGLFLAVAPAGADFWPLKIMLITLCLMSGIGTGMLWKEYMDEQ